MADHALHSTHMGFISLESEGGVVFVERQTIDYTCPTGHIFDVTFAIDARVPDVWDCPQYSQEVLRVGIEGFAEKKTIKPQKAHWEQLRDRRSIEGIGVLLGGRLEAYQSGRHH